MSNFKLLNLNSKKKFSSIISKEIKINYICVYRLISDEQFLNKKISEMLIKKQINDLYKGKAREVFYYKKSLIKNILRFLNKQFQAYANILDISKVLYSGIKGKSSIYNAKQHTQNRIILHFDIKNFFKSISGYKIYNFLIKHINCSKDIANIITRLCTGSVDWKHDEFYLKLGIETSTILSFLVNLDLFNELYDFCTKNKITMTIYVDDFTFSWNKNFLQIKKQIYSIIQKHKIVLNDKKTRFKTKHRKKITITGIEIKRKYMKPPKNILKNLKDNKSYIKRIKEANF